jgi:hypothetical protein
MAGEPGRCCMDLDRKCVGFARRIHPMHANPLLFSGMGKFPEPLVQLTAFRAIAVSFGFVATPLYVAQVMVIAVPSGTFRAVS